MSNSKEISRVFLTIPFLPFAIYYYDYYERTIWYRVGG